MAFQPSDLGYAELDWWRARIEQEGVDAVRQSCREIGLEQLLEFSHSHARLVNEALGKGIRARESLLRKAPEPRSRHALLICAHYRLLCACKWIDSAGPYARDHLEGGATRNRVQAAAWAVGSFLEGLPNYWPFDDGSDPLGEGIACDDDQLRDEGDDD